LKQSEIRDQTRKGVKIKGFNYNFSGGLITKLQKNSMTKSKKSKRRRSIKALFTVFLNITAVAVKAGDVSNDNGVIFNQEACLAAGIPRHRDARQPLPKMPMSSGYKSRRRNRKLGEKERRKQRDRSQKNREKRVQRRERQRELSHHLPFSFLEQRK